MDFDIKISQKGDVARVDICGRLALGGATKRLRELVRKLTDGGSTSILVNLENVSYIDTAGLAQLVGSYTTVRQCGGELKLTGISDRVADLLELTQLSGAFGVVKTRGAGHTRPASHGATRARLRSMA